MNDVFRTHAARAKELIAASEEPATGDSIVGAIFLSGCECKPNAEVHGAIGDEGLVVTWGVPEDRHEITIRRPPEGFVEAKIDDTYRGLDPYPLAALGVAVLSLQRLDPNWAQTLSGRGGEEEE